jgi:hypothetical protein
MPGMQYLVTYLGGSTLPTVFHPLFARTALLDVARKLVDADPAAGHGSYWGKFILSLQEFDNDACEVTHHLLIGTDAGATFTPLVQSMLSYKSDPNLAVHFCVELIGYCATNLKLAGMKPSLHFLHARLLHHSRTRLLQALDACNAALRLLGASAAEIWRPQYNMELVSR